MLSLQFLTRLPFHFELHLQPQDFGKSTFFFPWIGAIVGLVMVGGAYLGFLTASMLVAAAFAVLCYTMMTGALHIDGFGNAITASKNKGGFAKLESMRVHVLSNRGKLAVALDLLLQTALLWQILERAGWQQGLLCMIAGAICAQYSLVGASAFANAARMDDIWVRFIEGIRLRQCLVAGMLTLTCLCLLVGWQAALCLLALALLVSLVVGLWMKRVLHGVTGDVLGLVHELVQIGSYVLLWLLHCYPVLPVAGYICLGAPAA